MKQYFLLVAAGIIFIQFFLLAGCKGELVPKKSGVNNIGESKKNRGVVLSPESNLQQAGLEITTQSGRLINFQVEVAYQDKDRRQGLMFRKNLGPDQGMLFIFPFAHHLSFWMKNTHLPLDIIFIDQQCRIVNVEANNQPYSKEPILSQKDAIMVLEINGGQSAEYGLAPGDMVKITRFKGESESESQKKWEKLMPEQCG